MLCERVCLRALEVRGRDALQRQETEGWFDRWLLRWLLVVGTRLQGRVWPVRTGWRAVVGGERRMGKEGGERARIPPLEPTLAEGVR